MLQLKTLAGEFKITPTIFPDKTQQVWKLDPSAFATEGADVIWQYEGDHELITLIQLVDLLKAVGVTPIDLFLDYLPYGRQDKEINNDYTFGLHSFSKVINMLGFNRVVIVDPHNPSETTKLIHSAELIYPKSMVERCVLDEHIDCFALPDKGAIEKYGRIYEYIFAGSPIIEGSKVRNQSTGIIKNYQVDGNPSGKSVLIVDDICDGGATFVLLTKALYEKGASRVNLFVSHGIFSKGLYPLKEAGILSVWTQYGKQTLP